MFGKLTQKRSGGEGNVMGLFTKNEMSKDTRITGLANSGGSKTERAQDINLGGIQTQDLASLAC